MVISVRIYSLFFWCVFLFIIFLCENSVKCGIEVRKKYLMGNEK